MVTLPTSACGALLDGANLCRNPTLPNDQVRKHSSRSDLVLINANDRQLSAEAV